MVQPLLPELPDSFSDLMGDYGAALVSRTPSTYVIHFIFYFLNLYAKR